MSRDSLESCNVHSLLYLCDESVCHDAFGNDCMEFIFKPNNHQKNMIICNFLQVDDFFIIAMMLFVTSYQMFLVFSFSMLGTELTEAVISLNKLCTMTFFEAFPISQQSSAISEAIYQYGWTERTPSEQKLLMFVQMRSQRRVAITVWKFFALGRASFSVVFNV